MSESKIYEINEKHYLVSYNDEIKFVDTEKQTVQSYDNLEKTPEIEETYKNLIMNKPENRIDDKPLYELFNPYIRRKITRNQTFELIDKGKYGFTQENDGIRVFVNGKRKNKDGTEDEISYVKNIVANIVFIDGIGIDSIIEDLGMFYTIEYINLNTNKVKELKGTYDQIKRQLLDSGAIMDRKAVDDILSGLINNNKFMKYETGIAHEGFFIIDGKLYENSKIQDIKYKPKDLKEAIQLLNKIVKNETHEGQVFRWLLKAPFNYCLKQLEYEEFNNKCLILHGQSDTNKTGAINNFGWIWNINYRHENTKYDSIPALADGLSFSTFPVLADEADAYLPKITDNNYIGFFKAIPYLKVSRTVKSQKTFMNKPTPAVGLLVGTMNATLGKVQPEIVKRYQIQAYDKSMIIKEEEAIKFREEYKDQLVKLNVIGRCFTDKIKHYFDSKSKKLNRFDDLTLKIMGEMEKEAGVEFKKCFKEKVTYDEEIVINPIDKIQDTLNKEYLKAVKDLGVNQAGYDTQFNKIINNSYFQWLHYQKTKGDYIIHVQNLVETLRNKNLVVHNNKDLVKELGLKGEIKKIKVNGKSIRSVRATQDEVLNKIFSIATTERLDDEEDDYEIENVK